MNSNHNPRPANLKLQHPRRYLRACGFSVVNLLDSAWESLDEEERAMADRQLFRTPPTNNTFVTATATTTRHQEQQIRPPRGWTQL